ncbi:T9SS type A sorting domain-containing protein [Carboxylicivirga sp. M1479]|uniref:T9SS type A sorting domain-containing protein n=1 Tax=Carboxylicivirga sp. M1479 TaxID=2594476 RepID=UPI001177E6E8|nr:T9SS type A sorting domain-containing protein [Carboxylicivirga sp. M1479]TRX72595.1 T9SS type A sorting domain-containing protein [Carboxylicivirga sp. M1479]
MLKVSFFIIAFIMMHNLGFAQTVVRQSIGTIGKSINTDEISVQQSIGLPYSTSRTSGVKPGFIQSSQFEVEKLSSTFKMELQVYPNPVGQELNIKAGTSLKNAHIKVIDMSGLLIYSNTQSLLNKYQLNCSNWPAGIYFVIVSDGKNTHKSKVVKK